jgi:hypothetical protein
MVKKHNIYKLHLILSGMAKHYDLTNPKINIHTMGPEQVDVFNNAAVKALELVDKDKFGLVATIGSSTQQGVFKCYDIDHIISPAIDAAPGEAIYQAILFYNALNQIVKEKGYYVSTCPRFNFQEYVYELCARDNGGYDKQIKIHNLFFTDIKNIVSVADEDFFKKLFPENFQIMHGSLNNLKQRKIIDPKLLETHFTIAEAQLGVDNNLSENLALTIAFKKLTYIQKHYTTNTTYKEVESLSSKQEIETLVHKFLLEQDKRLMN